MGSVIWSSSEGLQEGFRMGDDGFIDVDIYVP
jgi:hypothetical protein